jgi:3'(2'), 5'-bisphosphate nucleotidase
MSALDGELREILRISEIASKRVMEIYATDFVVEEKGPEDPVTRADREANDIITNELARAFPDAAIVAEESAPKDVDELMRALAHERVFFVDPVDGTREFANRNGEFAVMIGLAVGGRTALGVVSVPAEGHVYFGRVGRGAFRADGFAGVDAATPLAVTNVSNPKEARAVVSRSHRSRELEPVLARLGITNEVSVGSVGLKVARVVTGAADVYVHPNRGAKKWDSCAPSAILEAAGGSFTDVDGNAIDYRAPSLDLARGIAATNGVLHPAVIAACRGAMR